MNRLRKCNRIFSKKPAASAPVLIIKQNQEDTDIAEYQSIEEAIADLENDPHVPAEKIEKLKSSIRSLKSKSSIRIRNGEMIK